MIVNIHNAIDPTFRLTNKLSEVKNLVKLLQRLKLEKDSEKEEESDQEEIEFNDSAAEFDLDSHLVENYDEYYEEYGQTTIGKLHRNIIEYS